MTAGEPLTGSPVPPAAFADDDTEGCLCLVAGYARKDGLIARVTAEAERHVMLSPALGDFLQLRYVDLGPRPDPADDRSRPVRRIVADLMTAQETAGRSHFALIVIAKSATTIEELLGSCAAEPFLTRLRMRVAGIASTDDRQHGNCSADITSSPEGTWRDEKNLIDALRQRCEELPRYFAARGEPGLTRARLAALRHDHALAAAEGDGSGGDAGSAPDEMDEVSVPDVLDAPEATESAPVAPEATGSASDSGAALADTTGDAPAEASAGRLSALSAFRRRPRIPWRGGKQDAASTGNPKAATPAGPVRTAMGLVYLLVIVDQDAAADPALDRLQAALLDTDRRLAAEPLCGYQVRVIHSRDGNLRGELQDAGRLGRRGAKRIIRTGDFTAVLKVVRGSLRRDCGLVQTIATAAGLTVIPPTVVIFTTDPPMAELDARDVFGDLAAEATVVWVLPKSLTGLVSPEFSTESGATVLEESQAVADEILAAMTADALTS